MKETLEGNQIRFEKVNGLQPSQRVVYEFEMEALKAGDARFRVQITTDTWGMDPVGS